MSALALTAIATVITPRAFSSGPCSDISNDKKHDQCVASLLPDHYSVHDMGVDVYGGGSKHFHGHTRSVSKLRGPDGPADVTYTLKAAYERVRVAGRRQLAYTLNGSTPGPVISATQGDVVKVTLKNRNIRAGTSLHWHGIDVPNGEDGVAGVTQNAVLRGDQFVYRFRARDPGTYWYHSHQYSEKQVTKGMVGAVVIAPKGAPTPPASARDVTAVVHSYRGRNTINGTPGEQSVSGDVGGRRLRFVNTNQTNMLVGSTASFRVAAIDGADLHGPTLLAGGTYIEVPAAGRVDLLLDPGATSARVGVLGGPTMVLGGGTPPRLRADVAFDPLHYGTPDPAVDTPRSDRTFPYVIGQRRGYIDGRYGTWFSIDRKLIPHVPMFMVKPGETVRVRFKNRTSIDHPMHLHGQHMLVLSRDGEAATGSPWWVDTLEVKPGESYVVQVTTDNPGDWMFHCHILAHASDGLMTHMSYMNVRNPFEIGVLSRRLTNHPE